MKRTSSRPPMGPPPRNVKWMGPAEEMPLEVTLEPRLLLLLLVEVEKDVPHISGWRCRAQ